MTNTTKVLETQEKVQDITLSDILDPAFQDRTALSTNDLWHLSESMKRGQINPIRVRKLDNGKYERIAGNRRLQVARKLGWPTIKAIVSENISDEDAMLQCLDENLNREDLNPYDETVSILHYIGLRLKMKDEDLISLLYKFDNHQKGKVMDLDFDEKQAEKDIEDALKDVGRFNLRTLTKKLTVLNINSILIDAIKSRKLTYSNAIELNKLKDDEQLKALMEEVLQKNLPTRMVSERVKQLIGSAEKPNLLKDVSKAIKEFNSFPSEKQEEVKRMIQNFIDFLNKPFNAESGT